MPRDWLGRTSPKWSALCRVGRKTLTLSVNMTYMPFSKQIWVCLLPLWFNFSTHGCLLLRQKSQNRHDFTKQHGSFLTSGRLVVRIPPKLSTMSHLRMTMSKCIDGKCVTLRPWSRFEYLNLMLSRRFWNCCVTLLLLSFHRSANVEWLVSRVVL